MQFKNLLYPLGKFIRTLREKSKTAAVTEHSRKEARARALQSEESHKNLNKGI